MTISWLVRSQLLFVVTLVVILLVGDRSQPKIRLGQESFPVDAPLVVNFDRPVVQESVERNFRLEHAGQKIKGSFSWSNRVVSFTPSVPLTYGTEYKLTIDKVEDREKHILKKPFEFTFTTAAPRFLFLSQAKELKLYQVDSRALTTFSAANEEVISYGVSRSGQDMLVSYRKKDEENTYGLYYLRLKEGGKLAEKTPLYTGRTASFSSAQICNDGADALLFESQIDQLGLVESFRLVTFSLSGKLSALKKEFTGRKTLADQDSLTSAESVFCSKLSDKFVYRDQPGNIQLGTLGYQETEALGVSKFAYGFSPKDSYLVLGNVVNNDLPALRNVITFDNDGVKKTISSDQYDTADPAFSPSESRTALVEETADFLDPNFFTQTRIVLLQRERVEVARQVLTETKPGVSHERPSWSKDERWLAYSRVTENFQESGERSVDTLGRSLDGNIWLAQLDPSQNLSQQKFPLQELPLQGGQLEWLP